MYEFGCICMNICIHVHMYKCMNICIHVSMNTNLHTFKPLELNETHTDIFQTKIPISSEKRARCGDKCPEKLRPNVTQTRLYVVN